MILWSLWYRNQKYWEKIDENAQHVLARAQEVIKAWSHARRQRIAPTTHVADAQVLAWQRPPLGFLKCNVDNSLILQPWVEDQSTLNLTGNIQSPLLKSIGH